MSSFLLKVFVIGWLLYIFMRLIDTVMSCEVPGKLARHHAFNDVVARAFSAAGIPVSKEPAGLCRIACLSFHGRQASRLSGTLLSVARMQRRIWTHHPARQPLHLKWRRRARRPNAATWQLNTLSFQ